VYNSVSYLEAGFTLTSPNTQTNATGLRALPRRQLIITVAGLMLAMFFSSLDQTVVGTAMPRIIADLGGFSHYTWLATAYMIASTVALPITGKLTDMYGRKWFYIAGIIVFMVGSMLCGQARTMTMLIAFRGFQGIGAGMMMANSFAIIGDLFPPAVRGKYQGIMSSTFAVSSVIGPTLGGWITDAFSWPWVFYVNVPFGIAVLYLFIKYFPNMKPDAQKHSIDYLGVGAIVLFVIPLLLALSSGGTEYPWGHPFVIGMFFLSAVSLAAFILIEKRAREPIVPLWIFRDRIVSISLTVIALSGFGMFGGIIFIPLFFQGVLGISAAASGNLLTPMMLGIVVGSTVSGQVLSRTGGHYRIQGMVGLGLMAVGTYFLAQLTAQTSYGAAVAYIVLSGFGLGITMPIYVIAIQNAVPYKVLGVATSLVAFTRSMGGSIGVAVLGSVMTNTFVTELFARIPDSLRVALPAELLSNVTKNAQVVVSPEAQAQLRAVFEGLGAQGAALYEQALQVLRDSLASAISHVFVIALVLILVAFAVNLFLKEVPLRKQHMPPPPEESPRNGVRPAPESARINPRTKEADK